MPGRRTALRQCAVAGRGGDPSPNKISEVPTGIYAAKSGAEVFQLRRAPPIRLLSLERHKQCRRVMRGGRGESHAQDQRGPPRATKVLPDGKVISKQFEVDGRTCGRQQLGKILRPGARRYPVRGAIEDSRELRGNVGRDVCMALEQQVHKVRERGPGHRPRREESGRSDGSQELGRRPRLPGRAGRRPRGGANLDRRRTAGCGSRRRRAGCSNRFTC